MTNVILFLGFWFTKEGDLIVSCEIKVSLLESGTAIPGKEN